MKKLLFLSLVTILIITQFTFSSCTKTVTETVTITDTVTNTVTDTVMLYPIQGLWVGNYISATNGGTPYFFSFSIYPDGTLSYKSKGSGNTTFYAYGTWMLDGTAFSFSVVETSTGYVQTGTAKYNSASGTLTEGTISDATAGTNATWTMDRVN
jgi:hypothetical protein